MDAIETMRAAMQGMTADEQYFVVSEAATVTGLHAAVNRDLAVADFCDKLRAAEASGVISPAEAVPKIVLAAIDRLRKPPTSAAEAKTVGVSSFAVGGSGGGAQAGPAVPAALLGKLLDLLSRVKPKKA